MTGNITLFMNLTFLLLPNLNTVSEGYDSVCIWKSSDRLLDVILKPIFPPAAIV